MIKAFFNSFKEKRYFDKGSIQVKIIIYMIILLFNGICIMDISIVSKEHDNKSMIYDNWTIECDGKKSENVNILKYGSILASNDHTYVLKRVINKYDIGDEIINPAIYMEFTLSHIQAYIGDKKVLDKEDKDTYVISFPKKYVGKELKIVVDGIRKNSYEGFNDIYIRDENDYAINIVSRDFFPLLFTSFLVVLANIIIFLVIAIRKYDIFHIRLFLIGLSVLSIGAWFFGNSEIYAVILDNRLIRNIYKLCSIFLGCPSLLVFVHTFLKRRKAKIYMGLLSLIAILFGIVSLTIIHFTKCDLNIFLMIQESIMVLGIISGVILLSLEYKILRKDEKRVIRSFLILVIGIGYEVVRFISAMLLGEKYTMGSMIGVAFLIFVFMVAEAYFGYAQRYIDSNIEKKELTEKAYQDILTGLDNRSRVMEELSYLKKVKSMEYTIVNFDLNDLKRINDTKGHIEGDNYLCTFSEVLKQYLGCNFGVIGRVGGDEFVAISDTYISEKKIEKSISQMNICIKKMSQKDKCKDLSFAYGYISRKNDDSTDIIKDYSMADAMMYECKKKQKANR